MKDDLEGLCDRIQRICDHYSADSLVEPSTAYSSGGDLEAASVAARLARAAGNVARGDAAAMSRFGIWGSDVLLLVREGLASIERGEESIVAADALRKAANAMSAFCDVQAVLDDMGIGEIPAYLGGCGGPH